MVRRAQGDAPRRRVARERKRPVQLAPGAAQRQHGRVRAAPDSDVRRPCARERGGRGVRVPGCGARAREERVRGLRRRDVRPLQVVHLRGRRTSRRPRAFLPMSAARPRRRRETKFHAGRPLSHAPPPRAAWHRRGPRGCCALCARHRRRARGDLRTSSRRDGTRRPRGPSPPGIPRGPPASSCLRTTAHEMSFLADAFYVEDLRPIVQVRLMDGLYEFRCATGPRPPGRALSCTAVPQYLRHLRT